MGSVTAHKDKTSWLRGQSSTGTTHLPRKALQSHTPSLAVCSWYNGIRNKLTVQAVASLKQMDVNYSVVMITLHPVQSRFFFFSAFLLHAWLLLDHSYCGVITWERHHDGFVAWPDFSELGYVTGNVMCCPCSVCLSSSTYPLAACRRQVQLRYIPISTKIACCLGPLAQIKPHFFAYFNVFCFKMLLILCLFLLFICLLVLSFL